MNYSTDPVNDSFSNCIQNKEIYLFENFFLDTPSWKDFIFNLNHKFNYENYDNSHEWNNVKNLEKNRMKNDILFYNKLDPVVFYPLQKNNDLDSIFIPQISEVLKILFSFTNKEPNSIRIIFNFVGNESKYYIHSDNHDTISWHCIGKMEWRIFKSLILSTNEPKTDVDEKFESIILSPGDLLYIPKGTIHQVHVFEPRVSVIFTYNT